MTSDFSAEDVKNKLFHSLKSRGVLDSLKSQLRKQLIQELQDTTGVPVLHSTVKALPTEKESDEIPLFQRAVNSIVAEYLQRCNFEYTLSTFLPESGTTMQKVFSSKEILHLLSVNPDSDLYINMERSLSSTAGSKGFLWHFLKEVSSSKSAIKCDVNIQTEDTFPTQTSGSLEEKLSKVENEYQEKLKVFQLDKNQGMEERLIAMQKKYEMEKKHELGEELKKMRAGELSMLRREERETFEAKIKEIRKEYDEEFKMKNKALQALEKEMLDRVQRLQEVHQSEAYADRQKFLEELRSFKEREADLQNRITMQERSQKLEAERLVNEVEKQKAREDALKEKESILKQKFKTEVENFKSDYEKQCSERNKELIRRESRLEAEASKLRCEREVHSKCQEELTNLKEKYFHLQSSFEASSVLREDLRKQNQGLEQKVVEMKDYHALKEKEIMLTKDIKHLSERLAETNLHSKEQEKRHHKLVKNLTEKTNRPSKEVAILRQELKIAQEKYNKKEKSFYEERKNLEIELESEIQRANHFQKICEEQLSTQRFLETEIENLKMMQQQTERLLSMELRHQNTNNSQISSTMRSNLTGQMPASRRKNDRAVSVRRHEVSERIYPRNAEAEESSTMDESSLASIIEDKKSIEKFEKEAAVSEEDNFKSKHSCRSEIKKMFTALDASYRDFQSRMVVPPNYSVASVPSSLTFRRLASYHSVHSPSPSSTDIRLEGAKLAAQESKEEFRPLKKVYDEANDDDAGQSTSEEISHADTSTRNEGIIKKISSEPSDSDVESGRLNEDDSIVSSMNDLDPVQLPSGNTHSKVKIRLEKDASNTGTSLQSENAKDISILGDKTVLNRKENKIQHHLTESEENSFKISKKGESEKYAESVSNHSNGGTVTNVAGFDRHSDILGANGTFEVKELTEGDEGKLSQMSSTLYEKSLSNGSLSDTSANVREMNDVSKLNADTRRHSTELDMAEIKERRQRDTKDCPDETNIYGKENNTLKLSDNVESESERISGGNSLRSNNDGEVVEHNDNDPPIDPVMLKYMEMIKDRRATENKKIDENSANIHSKDDLQDISHHESLVSTGKDEEISMGKLSDDDFNWD